MTNKDNEMFDEDGAVSGLQAMFATMEDHCEPTNGASFEWSAKGVGFGNFYFYHGDGKVMCDSETMSKDFVKRMLCQMVDDSTFI